MSALASAVKSGPFAAAFPPDPSWPVAHPPLEQQVLELVNQHRATLGLGGLSLLASLVAAAEWKSRHIAYYQYPLGHDDPAPPIARTWYQRLLDNGYPGGLSGENIAQSYPTPAAVLAGWLASEGHRENIENPTYNVTGVGVATASDGQIYWTQSFGLAAPDVPPPPAPVGPSNTQLVALALAHFRASTMLLSRWDVHKYKTAAIRAATENGQALAALGKITD